MKKKKLGRERERERDYQNVVPPYRASNKVTVQDDQCSNPTTSSAIGSGASTMASIAMSHLVLRQSGTSVASNDYPLVKG